MENILKECRACNISKELYNFTKVTANPDGLNNRCKDCVKNNILTNMNRRVLCGECQKRKGIECFDGDLQICKTCSKTISDLKLLSDGKKICPKCSIIKETTDFGYRSDTKDNLRSSCKFCEIEWRSTYNVEPAEDVPNKKLCSKCNILKPIEDFTKSSQHKLGVRSDCKACIKIYTDSIKDTRPKKKKILSQQERNDLNKRRRKYRKENKKVLSEKNRIYYSKNKERNKEYNKTYREKNKDLLRVKEKERCERDIPYKIRRRIKTLLYSSFKNTCNGTFTKNKSSLKILSCEVEFFRNHIESQFLDWMSWDKHGNCETDDYKCSFDFDHIIPISYAKTEEEIYLLNHWSNFQPMCSRFNRIDKRANFYPCTNLELRITFWEDYYEYV